MNLQNKRLTNEEFQRQRKEVLTQWITGDQADFEEGVVYLKSLPEHENFAHALNKAKCEGKTLIQPRAGVALIDQHIELLQYLQNNSEVDLLATTIDAYTRSNYFEKAQIGIEESQRTGRSLLNGFPGVNHGVEGCRQVVEAVNLPLQVRHGTPDGRLLAEITYTGGFSSYEGGGISYNIPYFKTIDLEATIRHWQYIDRLTGMYEEADVKINRESFGALTGTLVPPCISHAVGVIESLLAAEQGVKNITVGYAQCGNLIQDVAAIHALQSLTETYLKQYGYHDVNVTTVLHQWMGQFPADEAQAFSIISWGSAVAALAGATKVMVKTPHEAMGIPTMEANVQGVRCTKQAISMLVNQKINSIEVKIEVEIIEAETRAIIDRCFELGKGDIAVGSVNGFEAGIIDIPFAPSRYNVGEALTVRDNEGAIRFLNTGNLPFSQDLLDFHKKKVDERAQIEGRAATFQMVIDDVNAISKGHLVGCPKQ